MGAVIRILINAAALWVAIAVLDGLRFDGEWWELLVVAVLLGVANVVVKPVLSLLSLPFVVLTMGLFLLVVNAAILALVIAVSAALGFDLASDSFWWTLGGAFIVSIVSWGMETLLAS